jgi:predicted CoA-binding protein
MKLTRKTIHAFLEPRKLAIAGVSRNPKKFGFAVFDELKKKGFDLYPVNPNADTIGETACYRSVADLPPAVGHILIVTPRKLTLDLVKESVARGIRNIWIQQMSETQESLDFAKDNGVNPISKQCILMWAEPVKSFHKFHRSIKGFFGLLPR